MRVLERWRLVRLVCVFLLIGAVGWPEGAAALTVPAPSAAAQDPPAIPRALLKRSSDRPQRFVRTELFFGTDAPGDDVTNEEFLEFLDLEVTPRFPEGLTLFKGHGRFTGRDGALVKEEPFVVILLHPYADFKANDRKIEQIRRTYKTKFHQESVLRVDYQFSVRVSF